MATKTTNTVKTSKTAKMSKTTKVKTSKSSAIKSKASVKTSTKPTEVVFVRSTVYPCIERTAPKNYRARVTVNSVRTSFNTPSLSKAKTWIKEMKANGKSNIIA